MPALYRICVPKLPRIEPLSLKNPGFVTDQVFLVKGPEAPAWNLLLNILIPGFVPYSFNYSITDGSLERGGICANSLHDNTSDIAFMPADLPVDDDMIDIYGVIGQSKLQFLSSYYYIDKTRNVDLMESLSSFKLSLWILILFLTFFFAWLMKSKQSRTYCQYLTGFMDRFVQVITHFIGQNSIEGHGFGLKVLIMTLTFFSLMINLYYNGLIHTDLVVPETPTVPHTYQDFASTATVSGFPTGMSVLKYIEQSPQDSAEKRMYNELHRRNLTISDGWPVYIPDWARRNVDKEFYRQWYRLHKHVSIGSQVHLTNLLTRFCWAKAHCQAPELYKLVPKVMREFASRFENLYPWVSSDPEAKPIIHAFIKRKAFIPDKKIGNRVKRSIEHGMFQKIILTAEALDITEVSLITKVKKTKKRPTQIRECKQYSKKLKIKEVGFENLKVINFQKFARVFLAFVVVCCIALIIEVYIYTYTYRE